MIRGISLIFGKYGQIYNKWNLKFEIKIFITNPFLTARIVVPKMKNP